MFTDTTQLYLPARSKASASGWTVRASDLVNSARVVKHCRSVSLFIEILFSLDLLDVLWTLSVQSDVEMACCVCEALVASAGSRWWWPPPEPLDGVVPLPQQGQDAAAEVWSAIAVW